MRGDLIQMFKFSRGLEAETSIARAGRRSQLRREIVKNNQRHNFFTNRVANPWNALPNDLGNETTIHNRISTILNDEMNMRRSKYKNLIQKKEIDLFICYFIR